MTHLTRRRIVSTTGSLTALLTLGGLATAQSIAVEKQFVTPWFEDDLASVSKIVAGRFLGDAIADAAALRSVDGVVSHVASIVEPARFANPLASVEAHDIALLRDADGTGHDGLAALGPDGLSVLMLSPTTSVFEPVDMLGDSWMGATRVWCIRGGSGEREILGWHPASAMLLRASWSSATQQLSWMSAIAPELPYVDEIIDLDFGGAGSGRELAIVMGEWLSVRNWDGSLFGTQLWIGPDNAPAPGKRMFAALDRASGHDALAFHTWSAANNAFLVGAFNATAAWPSIVMSTTHRGTALVSTDYDKDGYEDLVLLDATSDDVRLARGSASSGLILDASFGSAIDLIGAGCGSNEYGLLAAGDLDSDEDVDLIAVNAITGQRVTIFSAVEARVTPGIDRVANSRSTLCVEGGGGCTTSLTLTATVPPEAFAASLPATHLEIVGWFLPDASDPALEMQGAGSVLAYQALTPSSSEQSLTLPVTWASNPLSLSTNALFISARFVRDTAPGVRVKSWPAATYYYAYAPGGSTALAYHLTVEADACPTGPGGGSINEGTVGGSSGTGTGGSTQQPTQRP